MRQVDSPVSAVYLWRMTLEERLALAREIAARTNEWLAEETKDETCGW